MKRNANHSLLAFTILLVCAISLVIIVVAANTPETDAEPEANTTETVKPSQTPVLGLHNNFALEWRSGNYWTWDYTDPYTSEAVW